MVDRLIQHERAQRAAGTIILVVYEHKPYINLVCCTYTIVSFESLSLKNTLVKVSSLLLVYF